MKVKQPNYAVFDAALNRVHSIGGGNPADYHQVAEMLAHGMVIIQNSQTGHAHVCWHDAMPAAIQEVLK